MSKRVALFTATLIGASTLAAAPAQATYPGTNGPIYYSYLPYDKHTESKLGNGDIYSIEPSTKAITRLTKTPHSHDTSPEPSPGGSLVTYVRDFGEGSKKNGISLLEVGTRKSTPIFTADAATSAAWTPDGATLWFGQDGQALFRAPIGRGKIKPILKTKASESAGWPSLTPDGKTVLFSWCHRTKCEIWTATAGGQNARPIAGGTGDLKVATEPDVSPDGTRIIFVGESNFAGARSALYLANLDGTGLRKLAVPGGSFNSPSWSPAGDAIVVADVAKKTTGPAQLSLIDPSSGAVTPLLHRPRGELYSPAWGRAPVPGGLIP